MLPARNGFDLKILQGNCHVNAQQSSRAELSTKALEPNNPADLGGGYIGGFRMVLRLVTR
jgi:hypothetical protein